MTIIASSVPSGWQASELDSTQIDALRAILDDLRTAAIRRLEFDTSEPVERDSDDFDQMLERYSLDSAREDVVAIDAALDRMSNDVYGRCEHCDGAIPYERLTALPLARFCVSCAHHDGAAASPRRRRSG